MRMERSTRQGSLFLWATMAALLSQNLVVPVMALATFDDQKNYYSPDPNIGTPPTPTGSYPSPSHGSGGHHGGSPSHGTPSHGGGSYEGTPPSNCGKPPSGGHHHDPSPSPPSGGHGGYYNPPTPTPTTPSTPSYTPTPTTPSTPTPIIETPPTPIVPSPPFEPSSPPFAFDPNSPPFTCDYWKNHPGLIWGLVGFWGTVGSAFGTASVPGIGSNMNLLQALSNTRNDGLGELYREGTASLLNSMVSKRFPYTTKQVRDSFGAALSSNKAAAALARLFKLANEGHLKPRV